MAGYYIAHVSINDPDKYKNYTALTPAAISQYDGEFLVRGGPSDTVDGPDETRRIVVLKFPSVDRAREFYNSPEYTSARKEREGAAIMHATIVEGA